MRGFLLKFRLPCSHFCASEWYSLRRKPEALKPSSFFFPFLQCSFEYTPSETDILGNSGSTISFVKADGGVGSICLPLKFSAWNSLPAAQFPFQTDITSSKEPFLSQPSSQEGAVTSSDCLWKKQKQKTRTLILRKLFGDVFIYRSGSLLHYEIFDIGTLCPLRSVSGT